MPVYVLLVAALVLFVLAALRIGGKFDLGWAGQACLVLALLLSRGIL